MIVRPDSSVEGTSSHSLGTSSGLQLLDDLLRELLLAITQAVERDRKLELRLPDHDPHLVLRLARAAPSHDFLEPLRLAQSLLLAVVWEDDARRVSTVE